MILLDCGAYPMNVHYQGASGHFAVSDEDAAEMLKADAGPERKALLRRWLDKSKFWDKR